MMGGLKENAEKSASKLKEVHEDKMENLANELKQMRSSLPDLQGMKLDFSASGLHEARYWLPPRRSISVTPRPAIYGSPR